MEFVSVRNGDIELNVAIKGKGPLILCVHGWPELWYSWRHQIAHFADAGYQVAAMDVRGYGGSSKPHDIAAYTLTHLTSDVAAVIDELGGGTAILFGHDWGAPIVWNTALLYPDKVQAVALLSVPYYPSSELKTLDLWRQFYSDQFFYQLYFQDEGVAETELEADIAASLRKAYFAISGGAKLDQWLEPKPRDAGLLDGMVDPDPFPAWMSEDDLQVYVDAFTAGGFRGPINRYRAQDLDHEQLVDLRGAILQQPSYFVGGERDAVRHFVPGNDGYADPGHACADFRGSLIIPGVGHWVQQEAPDETSKALGEFLKGI
jgi:pimeloyl-ACP methyl ester carboxylesterase